MVDAGHPDPLGHADDGVTPESDAMQVAIDALEMAQTGLQWYRGMMPEYVDGSDDEADEQIAAAIAGLRTALGVTVVDHQAFGARTPMGGNES